MTHSDLHLLVLSEEQIRVLVTALGHYSDEFALTVEAPTINGLFDKLNGHLPVVHEPPC